MPLIHKFERKVIFVAEVKRRKGESFESLFRRFSRRVQLSGRLLQARKYRAYKPEPSQNSQKRSALRRIAMGEKREYLIKTGKLIEDKKHRRHP